MLNETDWLDANTHWFEFVLFQGAHICQNKGSEENLRPSKCRITETYDAMSENCNCSMLRPFVDVQLEINAYDELQTDGK